MKAPEIYRDRHHAGKVLGSILLDREIGEDPIVLGLPRGGVPVAYEVAEILAAPLDVFLVRKLGLPTHPELAMGSIASGGLRLLDDALIERWHVASKDVELVTMREQHELQRRESEYLAGRRHLPLTDRDVIVVDDGLATGFSLQAAIVALRELRVRHLAVAVPVGPPETCDQIAAEVDLLLCPLQPEDFRAVGMWYENFEPTSDNEVRDCLERQSRRIQTRA
jgi:putative phosphoribosyl transferase